MAQKKKIILVVEDEVHIAEIFKIVLEMDGFSVLTAGNGREALDVIEKTLPDLIITDICMPQMDGIQFFLALKESNRTSDIPVIVVTVKGQFEDIKYASLLGMDEYITKPFDPADIVKKVKEKLS